MPDNISLMRVRSIGVLLTCFLLAVVTCEDGVVADTLAVVNAPMPALTISAQSETQASDMLNNPPTQTSALVANLSPASSDLSQAQPETSQPNQDESSNQSNDDSNGDVSGEVDVPVTGSLSSQTMTSSGSASFSNLPVISTLSGNAAGNSQNGPQLSVLADAASQNGQIATGPIQTTVLSYSPVATGAAGSLAASDSSQPEGDSDEAYTEDDSEEPWQEEDETPNSAAIPTSAPMGLQAPSTASSQAGNFISQSPMGPAVYSFFQQGGFQPAPAATLPDQSQQTASSVPVVPSSGQPLIIVGAPVVTPLVVSPADASQVVPSILNPVPADPQISSQPAQQQVVDPQPTPSPQNIVKAVSYDPTSLATPVPLSVNSNGQPAADSQAAQVAPVPVFTAALNIPTSLLVSSNQISTDASQPQATSSFAASDSSVSTSVGTPSLSIQSQPNIVQVQAVSTDVPTAAPLQPNLTVDSNPAAAASSGPLPNPVPTLLPLASLADQSVQNPQVTVLPPLVPVAPESAKVDTVLVHQDPSQPDDGHKELNLTGNSGYQLAFYSPQLHELWPFRLFVSNHPKAASRVPAPAASDIAQGNIQSQSAIAMSNP